MTHHGPVKEMPVNYFDRPFNDHGGQSFSIPLFGFDEETGKIRPETVGENTPGSTHLTIKFVRGHKDKDERQVGVLTEHILEMLIERQKQLNAEYPSLEGDITLGHLCSALHAQSYRTIDRVRRGVLNHGKA